MSDTDFVVTFENFEDGFSPLAHIDSKTFKGSKGQASEMKADVISNPGFIQQSPALADLTNGNQVGVVTEPIRFILDKPTASDTTFAVGTTKLFKLSSTTVASSGWPKSISSMVEGESIIRLKNNLYVFYNTSTAGKIAAMPVDAQLQYRSPQTAANDTGIGTIAWQEVDEAKTKNNLHAYAEDTSGTVKTSNYLKLTNFGFNVPSDATIKGVQVKIRRYADTAPSSNYYVKDKYIFLVKNGAIVPASNKSKGDIWGTWGTETYYSYGSSSDLWKTTLTPSDVNASNFGVAISVEILNNIAYIDHVEVSIFYTSSSESESQVIDSWLDYIDYHDQTISLEKTKHPVSAKEDIMVFGNGRYLGVYIEGSSEFDEKRLDFGEGAEVADVVFHANMWWIAVNYGEGRRSQIYLYDGSAMSNILSDEVGLGSQKIGFLYVLNGIVYVAYDDLTADGFAIGWVSGRQIKPLRYFSGTLPDHRQKTLYKSTILFVSGSDIYSFGAPVEQLPIQISRLTSGGYANVEGIAAPFGTPMVASYSGSNYRLAKFSGLSTSSNWKSVFVDVTKNRSLGKIHTVIVNTKALSSGARADLTIEGNQGSKTSNTMQITGANKTRHVFRTINLPAVEDMRVIVDYQNGSTSANCPIRKIVCLGNFVER